jgi:hypothetical protein
MGSNLPPGVSPSDLPGSKEPTYSAREEACEVCGKPVEVYHGRWSEHYFCDRHDIDDLREINEDRPAPPERANDPLTTRYRLH